MSYKVVENTAYRTNEAREAPPNPAGYEKKIYQKALYERPPFTFQTGLWETQAGDRMSAESKGYVTGTAGTGETTRKNGEAFAKWFILPKRLVKTNGLPDLSTEALGRKSPLPVAIAPVGVQRIFDPSGEMASAAAAVAKGMPYIMSTASSTSIKYVAKANDNGVRW